MTRFLFRVMKNVELFVSVKIIHIYIYIYIYIYIEQNK